MAFEEKPSLVRSEEGLALVAQVRALCETLPEITEAIDGFGHTSFRVNDKPLIILGEGDKGTSLSIKTDTWTQTHLAQQENFYKTPYIGRYGWVSHRTDMPIDWEEIEALLRQAYKKVAPKRLRKLLEE